MGFLGLDKPHSALDRSRVLVLPPPLEAAVSHGADTARGPAAIVEASRQVELYDREHDAEPALHYGSHTLDAPALDAEHSEPHTFLL